MKSTLGLILFLVAGCDGASKAPIVDGSIPDIGGFCTGRAGTVTFSSVDAGGVESALVDGGASLGDCATFCADNLPASYAGSSFSGCTVTAGAGSAPDVECTYSETCAL